MLWPRLTDRRKRKDLSTRRVVSLAVSRDGLTALVLSYHKCVGRFNRGNAGDIVSVFFLFPTMGVCLF